MSRQGDQGKWAEGKVRDWLNEYQRRVASFCFNRILDARSARGAMANPQPGDFQWFRDTGLEYLLKDRRSFGTLTINGLIEVKSVEHAFRLPYANFNTDQVARMRIRELAGSRPLVLVAFRPEGLKPYWRTAPLEYFEVREGKASWDMSDLDAYTKCDDILKEYFK